MTYMAGNPPPIVRAPWTESQVENLNIYQNIGIMHPFTCGKRDNLHEKGDLLVATTEGWICPSCDYTQDWAHAFMVDDCMKKIRDRQVEAVREVVKAHVARDKELEDDYIDEYDYSEDWDDYEGDEDEYWNPHGDYSEGD